MTPNPAFTTSNGNCSTCSSDMICEHGFCHSCGAACYDCINATPETPAPVTISLSLDQMFVEYRCKQCLEIIHDPVIDCPNCAAPIPITTNHR